jgi:hypothetical protein
VSQEDELYLAEQVFHVCLGRHEWLPRKTRNDDLDQ